MASSVSVAEAKARLSELLGRAAYRGERFIIEKRGRPVSAIVSVDDLARIEKGESRPDRPLKPGGLLAAVGALADFDEFESIMEDVLRERENAFDTRQVGFE